MMIFSLSSVSAADDVNNETIVEDNPNNDISLVSDENISFAGNVESNTSSGFSNGNVNIVSPVTELSLKSSDDALMNNYADVSVEYKDYYVNVNNKYSFFTMNQGFKNTSPIDSSNNIIDILAYAKNNRLMINLNLLNVSDELELSVVDDLGWNFINFLISSIKSFF
ncbi:MAG: hypothetical protein IJQ68_02210 [Methanobrevibacter sp.]|uniref:hypothetical protein n=1 Tax=Methanobrevibacter sp. TaxID=66852 RepID=UPI0025FD3CA7|nr:hypothetical protein [Methanobrevibacter sp.]MBR0270794.1 hypothetical protein [Methanobrevibacter sp.]